MAKQTRPMFQFDFGARETEETLRTRLLLEAEACMVEHNLPMRQMLDDLRGYIVKSKGSDAKVYPILRIINRYLNVTPTDFRDLTDRLGWDKALEFIDGVRPPNKVFYTLHRLQNEGTDPALVSEFWGKVLDAIERGEENHWYYVVLCNEYLYEKRNLRPGYNLASSS